MPRPVWKGSLKLSLITIPIKVYAATVATADVSFRQLHRKCHTPIQLRKWCPHCEEEVASDDIVRGHESAKGEFVIVEDDEIDRLRPEASHVVEISQIADASIIDPIYIERVYYLTPAAAASGAPFAVIRDALGERAGIGYLALHGREYVVAVLARDSALALYTLRTAGEVRALDAIDDVELAAVRVKPDEVKLARQVLGSLRPLTDLSTLTDHYEEALRKMLATKAPESPPTSAGVKGRKAPVVNLMDALRRSLAQVPVSRKAAGTSGPRRRKTARVIAHRTRKAS